MWKDRQRRRGLRGETGRGTSSDQAPPACISRWDRARPLPPRRSHFAESPEKQQAEEGWYLDLLEWERGLLWQQIALTL